MAKTKSKKKATRSAKRRNGNPQSKAAFGGKAEFVRSRPEKTARQIVAEAAERGIELTAGHVYNVRASDKRAGRSRPTTARTRASQPSDDLAQQLRLIAVRIGLDRAEAIFSELKSAFSGGSLRVARRPRRVDPLASVLSAAAESKTEEHADTGS
jgi:hypothetical protein